MVVELDGDVIRVDLDAAKWIEVMDGQWAIQLAKPTVSKISYLITFVILQILIFLGN